MTCRWLFLLLLPIPAYAQEQPTCDDLPVYQALNFWLGNWAAYQEGEQVGENRIEKILGGCAILEHWEDVEGGQGKSLFYVDDRGRWQQVWVTPYAAATGGVKEKSWQETRPANSVRFQGSINRGDSYYLDRTTLSVQEDGSVRQHIEVSDDDGNSWRTTFDAVYREPQSE